MSLGLGLGLSRNVLNKKYGLDYILNAYDSCVAFFSYYRSSAKYTGKCCKARRMDTGIEKDIGFKNGYIDYEDVSDFCAGTTGLVTTIYNSSAATGKQNAIQLTADNMPIIYEGGNFLSDGFKFVATNPSNPSKMDILDYAGIDIRDPSLSMYINYTPDSSTGYIIGKFINAVDKMQYGVTVENVTLYAFLLDWTNRTLTNENAKTNKYLLNWVDKNANGLKYINQVGNGATTLNASLPNGGNLTFGYCVGDPTFIYNGSIKTIAIFNSNQYDNYTKLAALI
ncbi:MAG: arabinofuranosidase catalytic domain-containing protein [Candidatus Nanoarchaeia archaeon]|jgi:hypothetical protein|nr:arabinofuranosidase catalytic domain-containing protein [Candidatus Nanoarchaeia archaeon]